MIEYEEVILELSQVSKSFPIRQGLFRKITGQIPVIKDVSLSIPRGKTLALVGESGSGKTTIARMITGLTQASKGQVLFLGRTTEDWQVLDPKSFGKNIQMVFQDPFVSLNPRMTIGQNLQAPVLLHEICLKNQVVDYLKNVLAQVGLTVDLLSRYPHQFSGGQLQRLCVARALALQPKLIILDESVSALDVSVQAQILNLLKDLQKQSHLSYLFITHDLAVARYLSDFVAVLDSGVIVEQGDVDTVFDNPQNAYTKQLLDAACF